MKNWTVYVVIGNPSVFTRVRQSEKLRRSEEIARLELYKENGWRAWMENSNGERICNAQQIEWDKASNA